MNISKVATLCLLAALASPAPALAQKADEQERWEQGRRERLETMERIKQEQQAAWKKFLASANADGVHLQCAKAKPGVGHFILYRGYAFRVGEDGEPAFWGRYKPVDGLAAWWDSQNVKWTLRLEDWVLQGSIPPSYKMEPDPCKKLKGDVAEIGAAAPELPLVR